MLWSRIRHERQHEVGGALTLAGRWRLDLPLGSCREEPGLFQSSGFGFRLPSNPAAHKPFCSAEHRPLLQRQLKKSWRSAHFSLFSQLDARGDVYIPSQRSQHRVVHLPRPLPLRTHCNAPPPRPNATLYPYTPPPCFETPNPRGSAAGDAGWRCV